MAGTWRKRRAEKEDGYTRKKLCVSGRNMSRTTMPMPSFCGISLFALSTSYLFPVLFNKKTQPGNSIVLFHGDYGLPDERRRFREDGGPDGGPGVSPPMIGRGFRRERTHAIPTYDVLCSGSFFFAGFVGQLCCLSVCSWSSKRRQSSCAMCGVVVNRLHDDLLL